MNKAALISSALVALVGSTSSPGAMPLSVRDSWRIGNSGTSFCSAQSLTSDKTLTGMFDSGYSVTCRDAALPVGKLFKVRQSANASARLAADRTAHAACEPAHRGDLPGIGAVDVIECKLNGSTSPIAPMSCGEAAWSTLHKALAAMTARFSLD